MELKLIRSPSENGATVGELLIADSHECYTLEDEIREVKGVSVKDWKVSGASAIPEGKYRVVMTFSPRFKTVLPELLHVPGFSGVRIHAGNSASDTEGCILVGQEKGSATITKSRAALLEVMAAISEVLDGGEQVWIDIRNPS